MLRGAVDLGPLRRHRELRLLFAGQLVSLFGSAITAVAVPYQVYLLTRSSLAVGALGVVELAAILGFALLGGALADARDRRRMVLLTELALAVSSAALALNSLLPAPAVSVLFAMAGVQAALAALQRPSLDALLPRLVEREEITPALALGQLKSTFGFIAGPAVAGLLLALVGLPVTYAVDVASFGVSLVFLAAMRAVPPPAGAGRPSLGRMLEGLRYARRRQELMGTYVVDLVAMLFGMPMALCPAIAAGWGGPMVLGVLYAAPAAGSLVANATSGWSAGVRRHGLAVILAAAVWGLAIAAFGVAPGLPAAVLCLAVAGGADSISGIFRSTIWNQTVPDALRGRLAAVELVSYSSGPALGNFEAGAVASLFSVRVSVVSGGLLCVAGCALCAFLLPAFRSYDSRRAPQAGPEPAS